MTEFKIFNDMPDPPARKRGGAIRGEKFPFSQLEVGQGFTIPVSEKHSEPWKSYQSTVAGAQRRFATLDGEKTRKNRKTGETVTVQNWTPTRVFKLYRVEVEGVAMAAVKRVK